MIHTLLLQLLVSAIGVLAVYQDEAFVVDWAKSNVGIVTHAVSVDNYFGLLTSSNILASLDPVSGQTLWRQEIHPDDNNTGSLIRAFDSFIAVYYDKYLAVRNPLTSTIEWDMAFESPSPVVGAASFKDSLIVAFSNKMVSLNSKGEQEWEHALAEEPRAVLSHKSSFAVVSKKGATVYNNKGSAEGHVPFSGKLVAIRSDFVVVEEGISKIAVYVLRDGKVHRVDASSASSPESIVGVSSDLRLESLPSRLHEKSTPLLAIDGANGILVQYANGDLSCYDPLRLQHLWTRHEGLAHVVDSLVYDIEPQPLVTEAELIHEEESSLLVALSDRIKRHIAALKNANIRAWLVRKLVDESGKDSLFGFNKVILVLTAHGQVYGLDSQTGDIKYTVPATAAIGLIQAADSVYVYGSDFLTQINPLDGSVVSTKSLVSPVSKIDATSIPGTLVYWTLSGPVLSTAVDQDVYLTELTLDGYVQGYLVSAGSTVAVKTFAHRPDSDSSIVAVAKKDHRDVSANLGKVLGDRSVLYKYLHANALAIAELSSSHVLKVSIIDTVTGRVLHTRSHKSDQVLDPSSVNIVYGEHWIVYSYDTYPSESSQITVWDLYESDLPNERTSQPGLYSSYDIPRPAVHVQSFFVGKKIKQLAISRTKLGITLRDILLYTESGQIVTIPKPYIDARRPLLEAGEKPSQAMMEEGLVPYDSVLVLNPRNVITHSRHILGIDHITTTPTSLESTSVVFAYGSLDLFYTRITPSGPFDMLTPNFEKRKLLSTVAILACVVMILNPMVSRKKTNAEWR